MEPTIYRFIFRYSKKEQILLLLFTLISFPFLYYSLDLPKQIINLLNQKVAAIPDPAGAAQVDAMPMTFFGVAQPVELSLPFGSVPSAGVINGAFKYQINVAKGHWANAAAAPAPHLYARVLRFPLPHFRKVGQGEIIPMITAEVEPLAASSAMPWRCRFSRRNC